MKTKTFNLSKVKAGVLLTICPTRSRLEKAREMYKSFTDKSEFADIIFCIDKDDPDYAKYLMFFGDQIPYVIFEDRCTTTAMYNEVATKIFPNHMFYSQTNDDFVYETKGWDTLLMEKITSNGEWGIAYGDDMIQGENMCTTSVISGNIVRTLGWLQLPSLTHLYGDNVWLTIGKGIDRIHYVPSVVIKHNHPVDGKTEPDATYQHTNSQQMYSIDDAAIKEWAKGQHKEDVVKIVKRIHKQAKATKGGVKVKPESTVGLAMICADFEKPERLEACLMSVKGWVDKVFIVFNYKYFKNYSKLKKLENVLNKVGIKYNYHYVKWTNFADMRNKSFKMAYTGDYLPDGSKVLADHDYLLWLDADDIVDNAWMIKDAIFRNPEVDCFKCRIFSYTEHKGAERILHSRLLKNHEWLNWKNKVHEDLRYSFEGHEVKEKVINLNIHHTGNTSFEAVKKKNLRNMKFTEQEMKNDPHPLTYYAYVNELMIASGYKNTKKAVMVINEYFDKFPEPPYDPDNIDQLIPKMWVLKGLCCMACGQMDAAKQALHRAWDVYKHPEAAPNLAECYIRDQNWAKATMILEVLYAMETFIVSNIPFDLDEVNRLMLMKLGWCYDQRAISLTKTLNDPHLKNIILNGETEKDGQKRFENVQKTLVTYLEKAEMYYSQYLSLRPNDLTVADRLCEILRNAGKIGESNAITIKMVNLYPSYSVGWRNLGGFELMNKRYVTGKVFLDMALKADPANKEIRHNLKMIKNVLRQKKKRV